MRKFLIAPSLTFSFLRTPSLASKGNPSEKSLGGVLESHTCSIKDNISVVSLNRNANKILITMKANNNVQSGVAFTPPKNEEMLLKKREKSAEDSYDFNLVGPWHLLTLIFENMA